MVRIFAIFLIAFALASPARAQTYPPDGPNIPIITNSEDGSGAFGQDLQAPPPPKGWDEESAWNMRVEGYNDNQGRPIYQPLVVNQDGREILYLGNLTARRDWGHARDYAEGMWLMLQQPEPDDYVLATGEEHSVREFVEKAFACVGRDIEWRGTGGAEKGVDARDGRVLIEIDERYFRPTETDALVGDPSKARQKLGWRHKVMFDELVREMVDADLQEMRRDGARHNVHD